MRTEIRKLLENVQNGTVSVDEALLTLKQSPYEDIGYAKVDLHRAIRQALLQVTPRDAASWFASCGYTFS